MVEVIYFQDKALIFSNESSPAEGYVLPASEVVSLTRAKVLNFFETHNTLIVPVPDPQAALARFATEFTEIEAAGGVVVNGRGEWLMIYCNARWDLPKGHVEPGESYDVCAAREIEEETGVKAKVLRPLCSTRHAYYFRYTERWELKRTHWYLLRSTEQRELVPQTEEGIEQVAWCDQPTVEEHLTTSYLTIHRVVDALREIARR
ncbi:MAG: NUDIX domain-containing protein [Rikenellaceae bacterium]|nr:NUDIX domain-containing protein [Rikenellaceae bacterium]